MDAGNSSQQNDYKRNADDEDSKVYKKTVWVWICCDYKWNKNFREYSYFFHFSREQQQMMIGLNWIVVALCLDFNFQKTKCDVWIYDVEEHHLKHVQKWSNITSRRIAMQRFIVKSAKNQFMQNIWVTGKNIVTEGIHKWIRKQLPIANRLTQARRYQSHLVQSNHQNRWRKLVAHWKDAASNLVECINCASIGMKCIVICVFQLFLKSNLMVFKRKFQLLVVPSTQKM